MYTNFWKKKRTLQNDIIMSEKSHILYNSEKARNSDFGEQNNFYSSVDKNLTACNNSSITITGDDSRSSNNNTTKEKSKAGKLILTFVITSVIQSCT